MTGYKVYRGTVSGGTKTLVTTLAVQLSYKDTATARGVTYYYQVTALSAGSEGPASNEASARAS